MTQSSEERISEPVHNLSLSAQLLEQARLLQHQSIDLYNCIDIERISLADNFPSLFNALLQAHDFDGIAQGGRGDLYRQAQLNMMVRSTGIKQLFHLTSPRCDIENLSPDYKIIDVLGGDGLLTRVLSRMLSPSRMPSILTSDISQDMIIAAQRYGQPALQQPAEYLLLKNGSMDAVVIAYGAHHIPPDQRLLACQEAFRVLKPGGYLVFHDFEEHSPVARWFNEVIHKYSLTGHDFLHFTAAQIEYYLVNSGFGEISVQYMYDPFVLSGNSQEQVKQRLGEYLLKMYGLVKLVDEKKNEYAWQSIYSLASECFQYNYQRMNLDDSFGASGIHVYEKEGFWYIEMPRVALVGRAKKVTQ